MIRENTAETQSGFIRGLLLELIGKSHFDFLHEERLLSEKCLILIIRFSARFARLFPVFRRIVFQLHFIPDFFHRNPEAGRLVSV